MKITHDLIERKTGLLIALVIFVVSIGGLVEIVPLFFQKNLIEIGRASCRERVLMPV